MKSKLPVHKFYFLGICLMLALPNRVDAALYTELFSTTPFTGLRPWASNELSGDDIAAGNNWYWVNTGFYPVCPPFSAGGMIRYNARSGVSAPGGAVDSSSAYLVTPAIDLSGRTGPTDSVRFRLYCSNYAGSLSDSVVVYINNTKNILGATRIGSRNLNAGTAGWVYNAFQIPYVVPFDTTSSLFVFFVSYTLNSYTNIFMDNVSIDEYPTPAALVSASIFSQNTFKVSVSSTNQDIIGVRLYQRGSIGNLYLDSIFFNSIGCTNFSQDVLQAKVFYTGGDSNFTSTTQFGVAWTNTLLNQMKFFGSGACNTVTSLKMQPGYNYLWLAYDIRNTAVLGNLVDAEFEGVKTNCSSAMQGTPGNMLGNREIGVNYFIPVYTYGTNLGVPGNPYARRNFVGRVNIAGLNSTLDNAFHDPVSNPPFGYPNTSTTQFAPHGNSYTLFKPQNLGNRKRRTCDLLRGNSYQVKIAPGPWIGPNNTGLFLELNNMGVWIDYNADGDFTDVYGTISEEINVQYQLFQGDTSLGGVLPAGVGWFNWSFTVPDTGIAPNGCPTCAKTKPGYVRLRVRNKCSSGTQILTAINNVFHGECEDYDIRILADDCPDTSLQICKWLGASLVDPTNWHIAENWCPRIPTIVDQAWVITNPFGFYPIIHTDSLAVCKVLKIYTNASVTCNAPDKFNAQSLGSLTVASDVYLGTYTNDNGKIIVKSSYQDTVKIPNVTSASYTFANGLNTIFPGNKTDARYQLHLTALQLSTLYGMKNGDYINQIIIPVRKNSIAPYSNFKIRYYTIPAGSYAFPITYTAGTEFLVNTAATTLPLGLTAVANGPFNFFQSAAYSTTGNNVTWTDHVFPNQFAPFIWDGISDIILDISFNNLGNVYPSGSSIAQPDYVPLFYSGLGTKRVGIITALGVAGTPNGNVFAGIVAGNNVFLETNVALGTVLAYTVLGVTSDYQPAIKFLISNRYSRFPITVGGTWYNYNPVAGPPAFTQGLSTVTFTQHPNGIQNIDSIAGTQATRFDQLVIDDTSGVRLAVWTITPGLTAGIVDSLLYLRRGRFDLNAYTIDIDNKLTTAIRDTNDIGLSRGYILSENTLNRSRVKWKTGTTPVLSAQKYKIPFGTLTGLRIPLTVQIDSGYIGDLTVSTYGTNIANLPYPSTPDVVGNMCVINASNDALNAADRFWQLDVSSVNTSRQSLEFMYQPSELTNGLTPALEARRYNKLAAGLCGTGAWQSASASGSPQTYTASVNCFGCTNAVNAVQVQNVYTFSPWIVFKGPDPLGVQLLSFDARLINNQKVKIDWIATDDKDVSHYDVLKARPGKEYEVLTTQAPYRKWMNEYTAWDYHPEAGLQYYKLKVNKMSGESQYSKIVPIELSGGLFSINYAMYSLVDNQLHVEFAYSNLEPIAIKIINEMGQLIYRQDGISTDSGVNLISVNALLSNGIYIVTISNNTEQRTSKFVVTR
ncbi:MAG: T9SS type A sorting domain-containing protein [Bacteroidetes bacterium]|nr:T9SS type A sorting domain-containing protein [Bacteroidota bacterium]